MSLTRIALISTGGTIEKTYDELQGVMHNGVSTLDVMMAQLQHVNVEIVRIALMNKDSLEMDESDHALITETARAMAAVHDGVVVVHGTDTLADTGDMMAERLEPARVPIVLTGAMRPYVMRNTDAIQNMTEALLSVQLLEPGIYVAMHGRVLKFPGVVKDRSRMTFVTPDELTN